MARYPRADRNTSLECECGGAVVKRGDEFVCVGCGERFTEDGARTESAGPTA